MMLSNIILCQPAPQSNSLFYKILSNRVTWSEPAAVVVSFAPNVGASANNASANGGAFTFNVNNVPSNTNWNNGCGQSYRSTNVVTSKTSNLTTAKNALRNPHPLVKIARCRTGIVDRYMAVRNFGRR